MLVRDVMTRRARALREDDNLELAAAVMRFWRFRHLPIVDRERRVVGVLTPADLLEAATRWGRSHRFAVAEVMRRPPVTIGDDASIEAAAERMREQRVHALPVVDAGGRLAGIVTDVDVLAAMAGTRRAAAPFARVPVDVVMTRDPVTVDPEDTLGEAAEALVEGRFRHLPVVNAARQLVGILSERDLRTRLAADVTGFSRATFEAMNERIADAMTPDPISVRSGTPLGEAIETFAAERVGALPVVDAGDRLAGILSYVDVLRYVRDEVARGGDLG